MKYLLLNQKMGYKTEFGWSWNRSHAFVYSNFSIVHRIAAGSFSKVEVL